MCKAERTTAEEKERRVWGTLLLLFSFLFLFSFQSFQGHAEERAATKEELTGVKKGSTTAYLWEKEDSAWKLLYLDVKFKSWKYAKDRWVQIGDRFYYFNAEGKMAEGWFNEDSHWFFAQYDNKEQNSDTAGVVLTGWASIPDENGKFHTFYFEKDEQGRPRGMVQAEGETNISYLIEGKNYYFDALGYADKKLISFDVTKYPRSRV